MSVNRVRTVRMTDYLWEHIGDLAERNGRTIAEEIRCGMETWLKMAGNFDLEDDRPSYDHDGPKRQVEKMKGRT